MSPRQTSKHMKRQSKRLRREVAAAVRDLLWLGTPTSVICSKMNVNRYFVGRLYAGNSYKDQPWPDGSKGPFPKWRERELGEVVRYRVEPIETPMPLRKEIVSRLRTTYKDFHPLNMLKEERAQIGAIEKNDGLSGAYPADDAPADEDFRRELIQRLNRLHGIGFTVPSDVTDVNPIYTTHDSRTMALPIDEVMALGEAIDEEMDASLKESLTRVKSEPRDAAMGPRAPTELPKPMPWDQVMINCPDGRTSPTVKALIAKADVQGDDELKAAIGIVMASTQKSFWHSKNFPREVVAILRLIQSE